MTDKQSAEIPDPATEGGPDEAENAPESAEPAEQPVPPEEEPEQENATGEDVAEVADLRRRAEEAEAKAQEYWDRILRMEAEKDNIRKRAERDVASARRHALEKFATEMLAVRDSLELGHEAACKEDADITRIREGTELTLKMLTQALEKFRIEEINPIGEKFDPELHQAMSMQEAGDDQPANTVTTVMQKGYRLEDRLLRPALVIVAK